MPVKPSLGIRLSVEGSEEVRRALMAAGKDGEAALKRLDAAARQAGPGLRVVDGAAREARAGLEGLAYQAGPVGRLATMLGRGGLITAAVIGGLGLISVAAQNASRDIAAIGDTADRAGFDPTFFQSLNAAIVNSGQKTEGFEQALSKFNRTIGQARDGNKEALRTFQLLGVELSDIAGQARPAEDILLDVADAFKRIEDPARRASYATKLFEEGGRALAVVLVQGADGLRGMFEEARNTGQVLSGDLVRQSQTLSAEFSKQSDIFDKQMDRALVGLGDALGLTEGWAGALANVNSALKTVADYLDVIAGKGTVIPGPNFDAGNFGPLAPGLNAPSLPPGMTIPVPVPPDETGGLTGTELRRRIQGMAPTTEDKTMPGYVPGAALAPFASDADDRAFLPNAFPVSPRDINTPPRRPGGGGGTDPFAGEIANARAAIDNLVEVRNAATLALKTLEEQGRDPAELKAFEAYLRAIAPLQEKYGASFERATEAQREQLIATRDYLAGQQGLVAAHEREVAALDESIRKQRDLAEETRRATEDMRSFGVQTAESFGEALAQIGEGTDALKRFGIELLKIGAQGAVFGEGPLRGLFGNLFGGSLVDVFNAEGNVFDRGNVVPFARGGIVDKPTLFGMTGGRTGLMGEAGPEAVMPLARLPSGRLGVEATGGGSVTIQHHTTIHIEGDATRDQLARVAAHQRQMDAEFESKVLTTMRGARASRVRFG